jgi:hypothetical protein
MTEYCPIELAYPNNETNDSESNSNNNSQKILENITYFNAQGDLKNEKKVKKKEEQSFDDISSIEVSSINEDNKTHKYYIEQFLRSIKHTRYDDDASVREYNDDVFNHINKCESCKMFIDNQLNRKSTYNNDNSLKMISIIILFTIMIMIVVIMFSRLLKSGT